MMMNHGSFVLLYFVLFAFSGLCLVFAVCFWFVFCYIFYNIYRREWHCIV